MQGGGTRAPLALKSTRSRVTAGRRTASPPTVLPSCPGVPPHARPARRCRVVLLAVLHPAADRPRLPQPVLRGRFLELVADEPLVVGPVGRVRRGVRRPRPAGLE